MPNKNQDKSKSTHRVTLIDVAKHAGVSRATASLVLRESPLVADKTRERVQQSMQTLGYVYNRGAAKLRTQKSFSIGLVVTDISNPFYAELTIGAEGTLDKSGYVAFLANTSDTASKQSRFLETVLEHGVDGVLLCPAVETSEDELEHLSRQIPIVQVVRSVSDLPIDYVGSDNVSGALIGTEHLIQHGHQRIAFIGGPTQSSARQERLQGYLNALQKNGMPIEDDLIVTTSVSREGGREAISRLLSDANTPTAAICYNDMIAFGVMMELHAHGRVPGVDFAVIGFDNIKDAATWVPSLTTISVEPMKIGEVAVNRLLKRIQSPDLEPTQTLLEASLIIRDSCGSHG